MTVLEAPIRRGTHFPIQPSAVPGAWAEAATATPWVILRCFEDALHHQKPRSSTGRPTPDDGRHGGTATAWRREKLDDTRSVHCYAMVCGASTRGTPCAWRADGRCVDVAYEGGTRGRFACRGTAQVRRAWPYSVAGASWLVNDILGSREISMGDVAQKNGATRRTRADPSTNGATLFGARMIGAPRSREVRRSGGTRSPGTTTCVGAIWCWANNGVSPAAERAGVPWHGAPVSTCLLYTSPSPRDLSTSRMPSSA